MSSKKISIAIATMSSFMLPLIVAAQEKKLLQCGGPDQPACGICDMFTLINTAVDVVVKGLIPLAATLIIVWAGFKMVTNQGNSEVAKQIKTILLATGIGLVVIFSSYAIVGMILVSMGAVESAFNWAPTCSVSQ